MYQSARLLSDVEKRLPYYKGPKLSLPKFQEFLGATSAEMAQIVGKSTRTIQRHEFAPREIADKLQPLLYGIKLLIQIAEPEEIQRWLHEPLEVWNGRSPMNELVRGNIEAVKNLIERIRAGEGGY